MKNLKKLIATVLLTVSLSAAALADCEPPAPGQMPTGPCASSPATTPDDSVAPGEIPTPPASNALDLIDAAEVALWTLLLF
jgi:hypothetical protein